MARHSKNDSVTQKPLFYNINGTLTNKVKLHTQKQAEKSLTDLNSLQFFNLQLDGQRGRLFLQERQEITG